MSKKPVILPANYSIAYSEDGPVLWSAGAMGGVPMGLGSTRHYQEGDTTLLRVRAALKRALFAVEGQIELLPETPCQAAKVRRALERARYIIDTLNGLVAADGEAPAETWTIDERDVLRELDEAIESFGSDRRPS